MIHLRIHNGALPGRLVSTAADSLVIVAVGGLGLAAVMTQLAVMRELLGAFSGNELVFGICLGNWLLLTGLGTWMGHWLTGRIRDRRGPTGDRGVAVPIRWFIVGLIAIAIIPLVQVVAVRVLRDPVFGRGVAVGVTGTVLGSLVVLLPFCLVSGALLTVACGWLAGPGQAAVSPEDARRWRRPRGPHPRLSTPPVAVQRDSAGALGRVYLADTLGGVAGGVLFSFALVPRYDHFALLCFPAFFILLLAGLLAWRHRARFLLEATVIVTAGLGVLVALVDADLVSTVRQHRGEDVVFRANSPYGRLVVANRAGMLTFYENGVPLAATENTGRVEEAVLYALSQRPAAHRILLIGGGETGDAHELLRADAGARITYVELDPAVIAAGHRLLPGNLDDPRIHTEAADGRRFVQQTRARFDLIIVDLPDPSTAQINRYYTAEFFREARRVLSPDGVLAFGLARYQNYVSPSLARLLASAHRTLGTAFPHVLMIPGGRVYFLASGAPLTPDIAARLAARSIQARLVNRHYLDAMVTPDRMADLVRAVARPAATNTDFDPVLYYYHLRHWLTQFQTHGELLGGLLGLALIAYLARLRRVPRVLFAAGFAASGLEVVILLVFQTLYGSLYRQVGLVVTIFMAGLALGAGLARRRKAGTPPQPALAKLAVGIVLLAAALPWLLRLPAGLDHLTGTAFAGEGFILVVTLGLALLVGAQFPLAGVAVPGSATAAAARLFGADLVGAAAGALLVSALLVPLLGVTVVCLLIAGLNAVAVAMIGPRRSLASP